MCRATARFSFVYSGAGVTTVRGCGFNNNTADLGCGLYLYYCSGAVTVADSSFRQNTAPDGSGGAISD